MSDGQKEVLEKKVEDFIKSQPEYNQQEHEKLKAYCENQQTWAVTYGDDIHSGISGFGETTDEAFEDFMMSWNHYKGFEWLKKERKRLYHWEDEE